MFRPGRCLVYLAPSKSGTNSRRAFCVRGDGIAAFTDNSKDRGLLGDHRFPADAVFGAGGDGDLTEFPRTSGRGRDGNFWQPMQMLRQTTINVMVVDDEKQPMSMCSVVCVPTEPPHAIEHALPAGRLLTTIEGNAKLTGMPATGLGFALLDGRSRFWISPKNVTVSGRAVRITVPRDLLRRRRMNANESAAIATLKNICSAQAQCQASGVIDVNKNGQGEYGTFGEMSGRHVVRGGTRCITPPVLSAAFARVRGGIVMRSGYCFRIFLPGKDCVPMPENDNGGAKAAGVDPGQAEVVWCCYAWPAAAGKSGQRAFFINQAGDVLAAGNAKSKYSGREAAPDADSAFTGPGLGAALAVARPGNDQQLWEFIQ